jgi:hypothetical protein
MATKRPFVHPSRQEQVPTEPNRKRQKPNHLSGGKSFKKAHPINDLKSQVRSLRRLLEHNDDLPANVRVEKERALKSAQHELEETLKAKKRSEMIARYHKVRFFDRQKATKRLKRARKELDACVEEEGKAALEQKVKDAEVHVNYAIYYPLDRAYVALFPTKKKEKKDGEQSEDEGEEHEDKAAKEVERQGDKEMWEKVRQCMAEGTLDALRNGKLTSHEEEVEKEKVREAPRPKDIAVTKKKRQKKDEPLPGDMHGNRRERRKAIAAAKERAESDEESQDGRGFFE